MTSLRCRVGIHDDRPLSPIYLGHYLSNKLPPASMWTYRCRRCHRTRHLVRFQTGNQ